MPAPNIIENYCIMGDFRSSLSIKQRTCTYNDRRPFDPFASMSFELVFFLQNPAPVATLAFRIGDQKNSPILGRRLFALEILVEVING